MKIMILSYADVSSNYAVTLIERGHDVVFFGGGDILGCVQMAADCDGALLLGRDPDFIEFAREFEAMGKPVWDSITEIPGKQQ